MRCDAGTRGMRMWTTIDCSSAQPRRTQDEFPGKIPTAGSASPAITWEGNSPSFRGRTSRVYCGRRRYQDPVFKLGDARRDERIIGQRDSLGECGAREKKRATTEDRKKRSPRAQKSSRQKQAQRGARVAVAGESGGRERATTISKVQPQQPPNAPRSSLEDTSSLPSKVPESLALVAGSPEGHETRRAERKGGGGRLTV